MQTRSNKDLRASDIFYISIQHQCEHCTFPIELKPVSRTRTAATAFPWNPLSHMRCPPLHHWSSVVASPPQCDFFSQTRCKYLDIPSAVSKIHILTCKLTLGSNLSLSLIAITSPYNLIMSNLGLDMLKSYYRWLHASKGSTYHFMDFALIEYQTGQVLEYWGWVRIVVAAGDPKLSEFHMDLLHPLSAFITQNHAGTIKRKPQCRISSLPRFLFWDSWMI